MWASLSTNTMRDSNLKTFTDSFKKVKSFGFVPSGNIRSADRRTQTANILFKALMSVANDDTQTLAKCYVGGEDTAPQYVKINSDTDFKKIAEASTKHDFEFTIIEIKKEQL